MKKTHLYIFNRDNSFLRVLTNPSDKEISEHKNTLVNPKVTHLKKIPMEFWLRNGDVVTVNPNYNREDYLETKRNLESLKRPNQIKELKAKVMQFRNDSLRARILRNREIDKLDQDKTFHIKALYFINIIQALCLLGFVFKEQVLSIVIG